jgi:hypothetical protein
MHWSHRVRGGKFLLGPVVGLRRQCGLEHFSRMNGTKH